jgi:hypothetical protein
MRNIHLKKNYDPMTSLCRLRLDVKFNKQGYPVKVILWPESEYFPERGP